MLEHLFTWYGMIGAGLVLIILIYSFSKVVGFVWRLIFLGAIAFAGFLYFRHLIF